MVVDSAGFSIHYFQPKCAEKYRTNVESRVDDAMRVPDPKLVERPDQLPPTAVITGASFLEAQLSRRQAVLSRLPEHLRCVVPDESGPLALSVAQLEEAVELLLMYEDCFVGASDKCGLTW